MCVHARTCVRVRVRVNVFVRLCVPAARPPGPGLPGDPYLAEHFTTCPEDRPLIVQLCGNTSEELVAAARLLAPYADAIDLPQVAGLFRRAVLPMIPTPPWMGWTATACGQPRLPADGGPPGALRGVPAGRPAPRAAAGDGPRGGSPPQPPSATGTRKKKHW